MNNRILITGVAGFIGFSLAKNLLDKKIKVYGIDNFDDYYSTSLKKIENQIIKTIQNFYLRMLILQKKIIRKIF